MDTFYEPLLELEAFGQIREQLKKEEGLQLITGCVDSQKTHLMYSLGRDWPVKLILTYNELKAKEIYEEYEALGEDVYYYPARDFLFFQADIQGNELLRQRVSAVSSLLSGEKSVIITTLDGCMDPLLPLKKWRELMVTIGVGSILEMDACGKRLVQMGYERTGQVELPGQFAIRGGILDIYPLTEEYPVRIELWDDEVDSIRSFDAQSQRSMENLEEITLYPAAALSPDQQGYKGESLLDYIKEFRSLVFLDESNRLLERGDDVVDAVKDLQSAQGIQHHLRIIHGADLHAFAVLIVHDVQLTVCNDDAVSGAEAVLYPAGEIHSLLDQDDRVGAGLFCSLQKLRYIGGIPGGAVLHLLVVP